MATKKKLLKTLRVLVKSRIVPAREDPVAAAIIKEMEQRYGSGDVPIEEVRKAVDAALGEKLLSELVIEDRH